MVSIERIARRIVADSGNALDEYYRFYNNGEWVIRVVRQVVSLLAEMEGSMSNFSADIPKLEGNEGYIGDADVKELDTDSCSRELKSRIAEMKKKYAEWEKADGAGQAKLSDEYKAIVLTLKDYMTAYEQSCVTTFRNRYVEDERNVRDLLDIMHRNGTKVMNDKIGQNTGDDLKNRQDKPY